LIVGDSIIKYLQPIEGVEVCPFPGATIGKINYLVTYGKIKFENADYVILHVGTNNIANGQVPDTILSDYANLIASIRRIKPNIVIICSAILPRPVDHDVTDSLIRTVNTGLQVDIAKHLNVKFIRSYRPFCFEGKIKRYLFAKQDGGLHLNNEGANQLRHFFIRVISNLLFCCSIIG
jgi:lysophospholipase L1-like esterase